MFEEWNGRPVHALLALGLLGAVQQRSGAVGWLLALACGICFGHWGKEHFVESQPSQPSAYFCLESVESSLKAGSKINRSHRKWDWMLGSWNCGLCLPDQGIHIWAHESSDDGEPVSSWHQRELPAFLMAIIGLAEIYSGFTSSQAFQSKKGDVWLELT